jgi:hypothetical protein
MPSGTLERLEARGYCVPTDSPEADGTASWSSPTIVTVEAIAGRNRGLGYTYAGASPILIAPAFACAILWTHRRPGMGALKCTTVRGATHRVDCPRPLGGPGPAFA